MGSWDGVWAAGLGQKGQGLQPLPAPPVWPPGGCITEMFIFGETGWDFFSFKKKKPKHKTYLSARKINIFAESSQPSCQLQFA